MTVLAVFRSRAQTLDFISRLQQYGAAAQAVNTPKEAGVGCGLSAKFDGAALLRAKMILRRTVYSSFAGLYEFRGGYGVTLLKPLTL